MKAVVLAAGVGTRMRRPDASLPLPEAQALAADTGVKAMIPFRRPFLDYVLSALADAGCQRVCLVVAPGADALRAYYREERPPRRLQIDFATQFNPLGTADAVLSAESFAGGEPFLALNSDNYYPPGVLQSLARLDVPGLPAFRRTALIQRGNIAPERVRSFAMLRIGAGNLLEDILEKPDESEAAAFRDEAYVSMNCWRFDASIFEACRRIGPSRRGELELPDAVRYAIRTLGTPFVALRFDAGVLDLSHRSDIPDVERHLAGMDPQP